jgi:hypothetical protein
MPKKPLSKPEKAAAHEFAKHVFGATEGKAIAQLFAKSLHIMSCECPECHKMPDPKKPFEWAMVGAITADTKLDRDELYIVQMVDLHSEKPLTLDLASDGGASRVRFCSAVVNYFCLIRDFFFFFFLGSLKLQV